VIEMKRALLLFILIISGCSSLKVQRNSTSTLDDIEFSEKATSYTIPSMLYGIVPLKRIYESEVCPQSRIETLDMHMDPDDVGLALITLGIYWPQRVEILCAGKSAR
jgi:hypothetical protein